MSNITLWTSGSLKKSTLHQSVRESVVVLLHCTGSGDVTVYLDNFTFLLPLCDTSFQSRTDNLVFDLLLVRVPLVNFVSHRNESDLLRPVTFLVSIEETLGILFVPIRGALSLKVIYTKRDKE